MQNLEERHKIKFTRIFKNELDRFEKPIILDLQYKALSTSLFLEKCEKKGPLVFS